jgi:hypothetical protein
VVTAVPHIRYYANGTSVEGAGFLTRKGRLVVNWPEQQNRNGIIKNQATSERFKAMVRALKSLRDEMTSQGKPAAVSIPSFLIECLVWNVPDDKFAHTAYYDDMKEVLRAIYAGTKGDTPACWEWAEESGLKWLFKNSPSWTPSQVNAFVLAAWNHVGFSD